MIIQKQDAFEPSLCQELIELFERDVRKEPGTFGNYIHNPLVKNSIDLFINIDDYPEIYGNIYKKLHTKLMNDFRDLKLFDFSIEIDTIKIQKTTKGDLCYIPHIDNDHHPSVCNRFIAFIYYLNDVKDGGGTHFLNQGVTVSAERGKVVFFPPYWTHVHEGLTPLSGDKYIMTGWFKKIIL